MHQNNKSAHAQVGLYIYFFKTIFSYLFILHLLNVAVIFQVDRTNFPNRLTLYGDGTPSPTLIPFSVIQQFNVQRQGTKTIREREPLTKSSSV